jgi:hypothetical protein
LANDGKEWTEVFSLNNSGTYNSQWMIIDISKLNKRNDNEQVNVPIVQQSAPQPESLFNMFNEHDKITEYKFNNIPGFRFKEEEKGLFHILEQAPGAIEVQDMSEHLLSTNFWGSYNRPYFQNISKISGYYEMMQKFGKTYSYSDNPRAELITKYISSIDNIESLKRLMQTNLNISQSDYINTISPRFDLTNNVDIKRASGGIDTKIVNVDLIKNNIIVAKSGPSTQNNVKPFSFSDWPSEPHLGLPDIYDFEWQKFDENFIKNK